MSALFFALACWVGAKACEARVKARPLTLPQMPAAFVPAKPRLRYCNEDGHFYPANWFINEECRK